MLVLLLVALLSGCAASDQERLLFKENVKYILYIGINDKHSLKPLMSPAEAEALVSAACLKYAGGFTLTEAQGVWVVPSGRTVQERSLVCVLIGIREETVILIAEEILNALNQQSILIEKASVGTLFYEAPD